MENDAINTCWYTIFNPTSGGGMNQNKIDRILSYLKLNDISYQFVQTQYAHHEETLVQTAIQQGYVKFICIGGDGTIHHMINGIMKQQYTDSINIKLAVIPTGTGNDWVKHYAIPKDPKKAILLIKNNKSILQDIGKINFLQNDKVTYFNNVAGIGFDAFVVKNISSYKKWGSLAYLIAALSSFKSFKKSKVTYIVDSVTYKSFLFLFSIGICRYAGAGMQFTDFKNHKSGFFDFTMIKSISLFSVISQILKLYNGNISKVKETDCTHVKKFELCQNKTCYIQADGELIGKGDAVFTLLPNAIQLITS